MAAAVAQALSPAAVEKPLAPGETTDSQDPNEEARWRPVLGLPCQLTVDLPLPQFKVADFLGLSPGSVLRTGWQLARDIPLRINGTLVAWGEFEGTGSRLAVRLTELA